MLELQWDKDTTLQARFDDGYDSGFAAGFDNGVRTGFEKGENQLAKLVSVLLQNGKTDEIQNVLNNSDKRNEATNFTNFITFFSCHMKEKILDL